LIRSLSEISAVPWHRKNQGQGILVSTESVSNKESDHIHSEVS